MHSSFFTSKPGISVKTGNSLPILTVFFSTLFIPVYVVGRKYGTNLVNKKRTMYNRGRKYPEEKI